MAVRIRGYSVNRHKRVFVLDTARGVFEFPFVRAEAVPTPDDPIVDIGIDDELSGEAITYHLRSGAEGTVHQEQAWDYNSEPRYVRDALLYRLTIQAQKALADSGLAKREVIRRLDTSASQFYRLVDQTNYDKSIDSVIALLHVLGCEVDLVVRPRSA